MQRAHFAASVSDRNTIMKIDPELRVLLLMTFLILHFRKPRSDIHEIYFYRVEVRYCENA